MGFSVKNLRKVDYDFAAIPKPGGGFCSGKGVIAEPSEEQIDAYRKAFVEVNKERLGLSDEVMERIRQAQEDGDESVVPQLMADINGMAEGSANLSKHRKNLEPAVAEFCAGSPSAEEVRQLPTRAFFAFAEWLYGEFGDPNASGGASNR